MDKIVFLEPVFCERIWGGRNLESFNFDIPDMSLFSFSNIVIYMNRKIDPSIYPIFIEISKKESISFNV